MKLSLSRETILKPLQIVSGVVEKRQTSPVLSNVLLQTRGDQLLLTGTDLEVQMHANIALDSAPEEDIEITLPARKFLDICRSLPEQSNIQLIVDGDKATIRSGRSRFSLATLPANEFPSLDEIESSLQLSVPQGKLKNIIEQTQFSMAQQDVRYYLNGLLFEINKEGLITVATDGHRLAVSRQKIALDVSETRQVILPRKAVLELVRLLEDSDEDVKIDLGSNHIRIVMQEVSFTSKLIDGKFPDYQQVIPSTQGVKITFAREQLKQAFSRASILSNEKYRGMRISVSDGVLKATVHNPEQEEAEEELEIDYKGEPFEIGFNVSYLLDALNAIKTDNVDIFFTDANHSCLLRGVGDEQSEYVVMPMRL